MKKLDDTAYKIVRVLNSVASISLLIMMLFVVVHVVVRAVFNYTIYGTYELVQYTCLVTVCCALASNDYVDGNTKVTVIVDMLPGAAKKTVQVIALIINAVVTAICCYAMFLFIFSKYQSGAVSMNFYIPIWILCIVLTISLVLMFISNICKILLRIADYTPQRDDQVLSQ